MAAEQRPVLPYGRHVIEDDDIAAVAAVLRSDFLTTGPAVDAFERALAETLGARHVVTCGTGTAALHLAMLGLGVGPGDTVIVPAVTFVASANAARYVGADVVFADVDPDTALLRPQDLERTLRAVKGSRVRAVVPVHMGGQCEDLAALREVARRHDVLVIEDACHAIGTRHRGTRIGDCAHSDAACFSFHPVKTIASGEGGAITTPSEDVARAMRRLRHHGLERSPAGFTRRDLGFDASGEPNPWYAEAAELGFNHRLSDIHAALGLSQLRKLDRFVARRREIAATYDRLMAPLAPVVRPVARREGCEPAWHLYVVLIDFERIGRSRAEVMKRLKALGVGSQVHYVPVPYQPAYGSRPASDLPGAEAYYRRCLSLPLYPSLSDEDAARVAAAVAEVVSP